MINVTYDNGNPKYKTLSVGELYAMLEGLPKDQPVVSVCEGCIVKVNVLGSTTVYVDGKPKQAVLLDTDFEN